MKIALHEADKTGFPNLALMKISAYHKAKGDEVVWYDHLWSHTYDKVYSSKVFTFTPEPKLNGNVICVDTWPGGVYIADDYDVTLSDELGLDVMGGTLANRDDTNAERAWPTDGTYVIRRRVYNCLTLGVADASIKPTYAYMNIYFERKNLEGV